MENEEEYIEPEETLEGQRQMAIEMLERMLMEIDCGDAVEDFYLFPKFITVIQMLNAQLQNQLELLRNTIAWEEFMDKVEKNE